MCDVFVKINQAPYLLQLDLHDAVDLDTSRVLINREERKVVLTLPKVAPAQWPDIAISADAAGGLAARREASLARQRAKADEVRTRQLPSQPFLSSFICCVCVFLRCIR